MKQTMHLLRDLVACKGFILKSANATFLAVASFVFVLSSPAYADVCQKVRPGWNAEGGPMTILGEASYLIFSPGGIMLLLMIPLAIRFQKIGFSLVVAASALLIAGFRYYQTIQPIGIDVDAIKQGCIGEPWLGIAVLVFLALLVIGWQFFGSKREVSA